MRPVATACVFLLAPLILPGCLSPVPDDAPASWPLLEGRNGEYPAAIEKERLDPAEGYRVHQVSVTRGNGRLRRSFEVDMARAGRYFLKAWAESPSAADWPLFVDGVQSEDLVLHVEPGSWGYAELRRRDGTPSAVELTEGRHSLGFESSGTAVPALENVWLSDQGPPEVPANGFAEYLRGLRISGITQPASEAAPDDAPETTLEPALEPPPAPVLGEGAGGSLVAYAHGLRYASYTWTTTLWLQPGAAYRFTTSELSPEASCRPVLHLFHEADPGRYSRRSDLGAAGAPSLAARVPTAGFYRLLLSAQTSAGKGTATVLLNGSVLCSLCPVAGDYLPMGSAIQDGVQNYFTASAGADASLPHPDTRIFLIGDALSGRRVRLHNDDFAGGKHAWNRLSRIRAAIGTPIDHILVSTYSSATAGYVKVLGKVPAMSLSSMHAIFFPDLDSTDAMCSAPSTPQDGKSAYNCFAWAGGLANGWQVPMLPGNPWYVDGDPLASFDNYFANRCATGGRCERYAGAWSYTRSGADDNNAQVALWARSAAPTEFTHASVRGPANGHPHGYAWESKLGASERMFHPRDALNNEAEGAFGHIVHLYTSAALAKSAAGAGGQAATAVAGMDEAAPLRRGLSRLEPRDGLQPFHREKIKALKSRSRTFSEATFTALYAGWKQAWNRPEARFRSDFSAFAALPGYAALLRYCRAHEAAAFAALAEKLDAGDIPAAKVLLDLALPDHQARLDEAVKAWRERAADGEGRGIIFSPENTWIRFARKVLEADL